MLVENGFDTGEILMNYAEGETSGPPMVMLHGSTLWWMELQPLIDQLESAWHIYTLDHRGHGKSGHAPASHYHVTDYATDVVALMRSKVHEPAVVIGNSLGGLVALQVAARLPQSVCALILLDPPLKLREIKLADIPISRWVSWVVATLKSSSSLSEVVGKCKIWDPTLDDSGAAGMAQMIYALDPEAIAMLLNDTTLDGFDWTKVYHQISSPTLLLWGEQIVPETFSSVVRPEDVEFLRANIAHSTAIQIKGVGHDAHWRKPSEVVDHMTAFLNSIQSA